jgi:hypothetical protein
MMMLLLVWVKVLVAELILVVEKEQYSMMEEVTDKDFELMKVKVMAIKQRK